MRIHSGVYPFIIVLKNKQQKGLRATGVLLGIIAIALFAYRSFMPEGSGLNGIIAATLACLLCWNIWEIFQGKTTRFIPLLIIAALGLLLFPPRSIFALAFFLLAWLERQAYATQEIGFSEDHIIFNGLWPKKINWTELSNVILKDGILTLDYKNNRLLQQETDDLDDDDYGGEEDEFNNWCRQQLDRPGPALGK
jgi:hypothetical protein